MKTDLYFCLIFKVTILFMVTVVTTVPQLLCVPLMPALSIKHRVEFQESVSIFMTYDGRIFVLLYVPRTCVQRAILKNFNGELYFLYLLDRASL